ncbi:MAG: hypothetical protein ACK5MZ_06875 [Aestuariibaculum sp.]
MPKYLRYVEFTCSKNVYEKYEDDFSKVTKYLSRIYEYYICPFPSHNVSKILAFLSTELKTDFQINNSTPEIPCIEIFFDESYFKNLKGDNRIMYIQELYLKGVEFIAKMNKWKDFEDLKKKHKTLIEKKLTFRDYFKNAKSSPNRKQKAHFYFEFDSKSDAGYISIFNKNKIEKRIKFMNNAYSFFSGGVKTFNWIDNETIRIDYYNKRDYWTINTKSKEVEFHYPRIEKKDAHSYYDLALIYLVGNLVLKNYDKGIYYLKKSAEMKHKRAIKKLEEITGGNNGYK